MAQQNIDVGTTVNDGTGDPLRTAFMKANSNFNELYTAEPKGMAGALLGQAYLATGTGTGVWTDIAPSITFIDTLEDFPVQNAESVTLEAQRVYIVSGVITTDKYFIVEDEAVLTSINLLGPTLTYTGTGAMFRGTDASFIHRDMRVSFPNGTGYEFTDTVGGTKLFICTFVRIVQGTKFANLHNMQSVIFNNSSTLDMAGGITITGSSNIVTSINKLYIGSTSATCVGIELDPTMSAPTVEINDFILQGVPGAVGISAAEDNGNIPAGSIAQVTNCEFLGGVTPISGAVLTDTRWDFEFNAGLADTIKDAIISTHDNELATIIATQSTPVRVNGDFVEERASHFITDITGRITYVGERPITVPIDAVFTVRSAGPNNQQYATYIAKNGVTIAGSKSSNRCDAADPKMSFSLWQITFNQYDYVEPFIENNTSNNNLIVDDCVIRIN